MKIQRLIKAGVVQVHRHGSAPTADEVDEEGSQTDLDLGQSSCTQTLHRDTAGESLSAKCKRFWSCRSWGEI